MRQQLKETRLAVNQLLQRQWESEDFLDLPTLLRVAQRGIQNTRDQLDQVRLEVDARMESQADRIHTMEVGFAELNEWAEKVADKTNPE